MMNVHGGNVETGFCVLCKNPTSNLCSVCKDWYCSSSCQKRDWPTHRYICFPMPKLISSGSMQFNSNDLPSIISSRSVDSSKHVAKTNSNEQDTRILQQLLQINHQNEEVLKENTIKTSACNNNQAKHVDRAPNQRPQTVNQLVPPQTKNQLVAPQTKNQLVTAQTNNQLLPPKTPQTNNQLAPTVPVKYPEDNSIVVITGFLSLDCCYVISTAPDVQVAYKHILTKINNYGKTAPKLCAPRIRSLAIASSNNQFYRVAILNINREKLRVLFIDMGFESSRSLKELCQISDECANLPQYAMPVQLFSLPKRRFLPQEYKILQSFANTQYKIVYRKDYGKKAENKIVELLQPISMESINQQILQSLNKPVAENKIINNENATTPEKTPQVHNAVSPAQSVKSISTGLQSRLSSVRKSLNIQQKPHQPVLQPPFKLPSMEKEESDIKVIILDTSLLNQGMFGCVRQQDFPHLTEIMKHTQDFKPGPNGYAPVVGEYCMAQFDDSWYRAICTDVKSDNYNLTYIDFTNEETLTKESIRPYPLDLTLDCVSLTCAIAEFQNLNEDQLEFITKWGLVNWKSICVDKAEEIATDDSFVKGFVVVKISSLIEKMAEANLL